VIEDQIRARGSASILSLSREFLPSFEREHDDKEMSIRKKTTPEFRHRDRRWCGRLAQNEPSSAI
jgi:hypothetical protein